jgi:hypothetical protein
MLMMMSGPVTRGLGRFPDWPSCPESSSIKAGPQCAIDTIRIFAKFAEPFFTRQKTVTTTDQVRLQKPKNYCTVPDVHNAPA